MATSTISLPTAFAAGLISFLSPCVLPLVPGYLSYLSGVGSDHLRSGDAHTRRQVLLSACGFVLGFSIVFIVLGATATVLGQSLNENLPWLTQAAGALIIVFGLHTMGVFRIPALYAEKRFQLDKRPTGLLGAVLVGLAFAFGWTPCIGPILAGILTYAAQEDTLQQGILLLTVYSAGLGVPFLLTAIAINGALGFLDRIKRHMVWVERASGVLLIGVGVLIFTQNLSWMANALQATPFGKTLIQVESGLDGR